LGWDFFYLENVFFLLNSCRDADATTLQDHGKCPATKEDLTMDDIVPVKTNTVWFLRYANKLSQQNFQ
jgi:hypothetical protein